ncbi:MAG: GNAT family N-acetyltransferase [Oscillospiraceae bacterium]|jgi:GNAT superfamily N-acetyltransferase|nr:GNAT family N-acetyltransferase [Oscillospiraceae bacterium]
MEKIPIYKLYEEIHKKDVMRIADEGFGEAYMTEEKIKSLVENEGSFYVACVLNEVIGYCNFIYVSAEECAEFLELPKTLLKEHANNDGKVCLTRTMAVDASHRGDGIADKLFSLCLKDAEKTGLQSAWGGAWKAGDKIPMERIFLSNGFIQYDEIPMLWYSEEDYICHVCNGRCECTGVIYQKLLNTL